MKRILSYIMIAMTAVLICCTNHTNNSGSTADSNMRPSDTTKSQTIHSTPGGDGTNSPTEDSTRRLVDSMKNR